MRLVKSFFFLTDNKKIAKLDIVSVYVSADEDKVVIMYTMGEKYTGHTVSENELFKTKEDLIASLSEDS